MRFVTPKLFSSDCSHVQSQTAFQFYLFGIYLVFGNNLISLYLHIIIKWLIAKLKHAGSPHDCH